MSKTWDEVKKEDFPILLKFDDGTTRWLRHEVYAWMVARIKKAREAGRVFVAERGWGQALADEGTSESPVMPDEKKKSAPRRGPRRATRLRSYLDDLPDKIV